MEKVVATNCKLSYAHAADARRVNFAMAVFVENSREPGDEAMSSAPAVLKSILYPSLAGLACRG